MSYILKAETSKETVYYMNIICITEQIDCAEHFPTYEDAEDKKGYFSCMFHYEQPKITIEKVKE